MYTAKHMKWWGWGDENVGFDSKAHPGLWPFAKKVLAVEDGDDLYTPPVAIEAVQLREAIRHDRFMAELRLWMRDDQICDSRYERLVHAYGKGLRDLFRMRRGMAEGAPDLVVYPENEHDVLMTIRAAAQHDVVVIPFGGGSNIAGCLERTETRRMVVSLDMRRMRRVLAVDTESCTARIEAGAFGPDLEEQLNSSGYTLGHFPDSFLHSTLGGWLATRSAGMQSDARGKIEDMVVSLKIVTPVGMLATRVAARSATGPDLNQIVVGSEGTMTVHRRGVQAYHGVLMPDFRSGVELMRRCSREDSAPSTMRLSNAEETELGLTLKPPGGPGARAFKAMVKAYLRRVRGFNLGEACLLILGWEGSAGDVGRRRARSLAIARGLNGFSLGESAGNAWFDRKYDYPLLRDLVMEHGGMVDVTEATVTWRDATATYERVHGAMHRELCREAFPGYVGCHLSHAYETGVCIYFTFAAARAKGAEMEQYLRAKALSVELLLGAGASLSHHHSIGYEHLPWMEDYVGPAGMAALRGLKAALDPGNICNPGKLLPSAESALGQYWPGYPAGVGAGRAP